ncbi:MAG: methylglutaconyl-CoA hydratase, partial [Dinoroseobacter sp.]
MLETLLVETDARGVALVTLNRPEKHNAMSGQMIADLTLLAGEL